MQIIDEMVTRLSAKFNKELEACLKEALSKWGIDHRDAPFISRNCEITGLGATQTLLVYGFPVFCWEPEPDGGSTDSSRLSFSMLQSNVIGPENFALPAELLKDISRGKEAIASGFSPLFDAGTMYKAVRLDNTIEPVEVLRKTACTIRVKFRHGEKQENKETEYHKYFDTRREAAHHLIEINEKAIVIANQMKARAQKNIDDLLDILTTKNGI